LILFVLLVICDRLCSQINDDDDDDDDDDVRFLPLFSLVLCCVCWI